MSPDRSETAGNVNRRKASRWSDRHGSANSTDWKQAPTAKMQCVGGSVAHTANARLEFETEKHTFAKGCANAIEGEKRREGEMCTTRKREGKWREKKKEIGRAHV